MTGDKSYQRAGINCSPCWENQIVVSKFNLFNYAFDACLNIIPWSEGREFLLGNKKSQVFSQSLEKYATIFWSYQIVFYVVIYVEIYKIIEFVLLSKRGYIQKIIQRNLVLKKNGMFQIFKNMFQEAWFK